MAAPGEPDLREELACPCPGRAVDLAQDAPGEEDVVEGVELGHEVEGLEDHAEVRGAAVGARVVRSGPGHRARIGGVEACEKIEER